MLFFHVIFSSKLAYSVFRIECYKEYVNAVVELSSCIIAIYCVTFVSCNGIKKKTNYFEANGVYVRKFGLIHQLGFWHISIIICNRNVASYSWNAWNALCSISRSTQRLQWMASENGKFKIENESRDFLPWKNANGENGIEYESTWIMNFHFRKSPEAWKSC